MAHTQSEHEKALKRADRERRRADDDWLKKERERRRKRDKERLRKERTYRRARALSQRRWRLHKKVRAAATAGKNGRRLLTRPMETTA